MQFVAGQSRDKESKVVGTSLKPVKHICNAQRKSSAMGNQAREYLKSQSPLHYTEYDSTNPLQPKRKFTVCIPGKAECDRKRSQAAPI